MREERQALDDKDDFTRGAVSSDHLLTANAPHHASAATTVHATPPGGWRDADFAPAPPSSSGAGGGRYSSLAKRLQLPPAGSATSTTASSSSSSSSSSSLSLASPTFASSLAAVSTTRPVGQSLSSGGLPHGLRSGSASGPRAPPVLRGPRSGALAEPAILGGHPLGSRASLAAASTPTEAHLAASLAASFAAVSTMAAATPAALGLPPPLAPPPGSGPEDIARAKARRDVSARSGGHGGVSAVQATRSGAALSGVLGVIAGTTPPATAIGAAASDVYAPRPLTGTTRPAETTPAAAAAGARAGAPDTRTASEGGALATEADAMFAAASARAEAKAQAAAVVAAALRPAPVPSRYQAAQPPRGSKAQAAAAGAAAAAAASSAAALHSACGGAGAGAVYGGRLAVPRRLAPRAVDFEQQRLYSTSP